MFDAFLSRLARNSSWGIASTLIEFALSLAETSLVARVLGVADYGRLALVVTTIVSIKQLVDVRAWEGATRYLTKFIEEHEPALALATLKLALMLDTVVAITAYGISMALAGFISSRLLRQPGLRGPFAWYSLTLLFTAVNGTMEAVLRVFDRFRDLALRSAGQAIWRLGFVGAAVLFGGRIRALVVAYLLSDLAGAAMLIGLAGRQVRRWLWSARGRARVSVLRPYLREMAWFTIHTAIRATLKLNRQVGILAIGYFRTPTEVGYYRVARRMGAAIQELSDPFYFAVFPEFTRAGVRTPRQLAGLVLRTATAAAAMAIPVVLLAVRLAPHIFQVWVGPQYAPAVGPFRVIMVAMGLAIATFWATPAALGIGRPDIATSGVASGVLANVVLVLFLVPKLGPIGAALGDLGGYIVFSIVIGTRLVRRLGIRLFDARRFSRAGARSR